MCQNTILTPLQSFSYQSSANPLNPKPTLSNSYLSSTGPGLEFPGVLWSSLKFFGVSWSFLFSLVIHFPFVSFVFSPSYSDFHISHSDLSVSCLDFFVVYLDLLQTFVYVTLSLCHSSPFDMSLCLPLFQPFAETLLYVLT